MSEFEYASVIVSIVLALGIAEILRFLADTLREAKARQVYWIHMLWVILLLELQVEFWWRMWAFKDHLAVGPQLALVLVGPSILFMATRIILPRQGEERDLESLYFQHRSAFFSTMVAMNLWSTATTSWSFPDDQRHLLYASLVATVLVVSAFIACIFSARRTLHASVVLVIIGMELAEMASWAFQQ